MKQVGQCRVGGVTMLCFPMRTKSTGVCLETRPRREHDTIHLAVGGPSITFDERLTFVFQAYIESNMKSS